MQAARRVDPRRAFASHPHNPQNIKPEPKGTPTFTLPCPRSCDNRRRYRLDKIEAAVIDGMARMLVDGRVPEDFFDAEMPKARADLAAIEAQIAAAPSPQVIALHPAALSAYRRALADLAPILRSLDPERDRELVEAFRALVDRVVVRDREDGGVDAEVIGWLGPLLAADFRGAGAGRAVAEVRSTGNRTHSPGNLPPITVGFGVFVAQSPTCRENKLVKVRISVASTGRIA